MKHDDIWRALDTLAAEYGLSPSGLAKRAGLDPTTFNPSKRRMPDGRARWPSTESLAKVLDATGASLDAFTALVTGARALPAGGRATPAAARRVPLIGFAQAGGEGFFDDGGYPVGGGWDEVALPEIADPNAYALEISGESMEPVFRDGDRGDRLAGGADPPRRPGGGAHQRGRSDGQAVGTPLRPAGRVAQPQSGPSGPQL